MTASVLRRVVRREAESGSVFLRLECGHVVHRSWSPVYQTRCEQCREAITLKLREALHRTWKSEESPKPFPPCGIDGCKNPSFWVDPCGVGFCTVHGSDSLFGEDVKVAESREDFDPWWAASSENPKAFEGLDYGEWP